METQSAEQIHFAAVWVGSEAGKDREMIFLPDSKILGCLQAYIGTGKAGVSVCCGGPGGNADGTFPFELGQTEGGFQFEVAAVSTIQAVVQTIVARKVGVPGS